MANLDIVLTLYREITAVYSDSHTKHINVLCGNNSVLLNVTADGTYKYHWNLNAKSYLVESVCELRESSIQSKIHINKDDTQNSTQAIMYCQLPLV
jgi:hypothetical protein